VTTIPEYAVPETKVSGIDQLDQPRDPRTLGWLGLPVSAWVIAGVVVFICALPGVGLFWSNLQRLWLKTNLYNGSAEWAHATLVPLIGIYYLYLNLDELKRTKAKPVLLGDFSKWRWISSATCILGGLVTWFVGPIILSNFGYEFKMLGQGLIAMGVAAGVLDWGLATLLGGLMTYAFGIYPGQNDYVKDLGMVMTLFGVVLTLCGWQIMKIAYFPILFLICALPWPGLFYSKLAMPLQDLAAGVGVGVMQLIGVDASKEGTSIWLTFPPSTGKPAAAINVAEQCAGLKSLMTFVSIAAAIGYLSNRVLWQKLTIVASAIPIAILCNTFRVTLMGAATYWGFDEILTGFTHQFAGMLLLIVPGTLLLLLVTWAVDKLVVEEADDENPLIVRRSADAGKASEKTGEAI